MDVKIHPHAQGRMLERGITIDELEATVQDGEQFPAKYGRTGFRRNFSFTGLWQNRQYRTKQVEAYAARENDTWLVITVIARYF